MAIDPREQELREEVVQAKTKLRRLKNRQKNIANSGVTDADINAQDELVKAAEKNLTTFRDDRITTITDVTKKRKEEKLTKKEEELKELQKRAREGKPAERPEVFRGGIPEREVRVSDVERVQKQVDKAQPKIAESEQPAESAYQKPLDSSQLRREIGSNQTVISGLGPENYGEIQITNTPGTFVVPSKYDQSPTGYYILPSGSAGVSRFVAAEDFANNLYRLNSEVISEYQKALNISVSGVMNPTLEKEILSLVDNVSYLNYRNALAGNPQQIRWEDALINPEKFNLKGRSGTGGGPSGPSPEQIRAKVESVKVLSTELGIDLDNSNLQKLARDWASGLYDATTIKSQIARSGTIDFTKGLAGETVNILKQYASDFGVQYEDSWFTRAATNILKAKEAEDTYNAQIREISKSRYPTLSSQIDAGFTVRQLASPYLQSMSRILEIDAGTIGLEDPTITRSLTGLSQEGKPSTTPLWQFEQELRKDPRWNFTNNAQQDLMGTARQILKDFGLVS